MKRKTFYYSDVLSDDFAGTDIKRKKLKRNYVYINKNPIVKFFEFVLYRLIATPLVFFMNKILYRERMIGKEKLKKYRKTGYFLYGNHTHAPLDAYTPTVISFPKKAYILVNPDATSVPVAGSMVKALGAMPVPDDISLYKGFLGAIKTRAKNCDVITIYPEQHIWPYYTGIRPFRDTSFKYPTETDKPVFVFTRTFQKRKRSLKPKQVVYVDGPFFPDIRLSVKENQKLLRDAAYDAMVKRSALSDARVHDYVYFDPDKEAVNSHPSPLVDDDEKLQEVGV
ncbi:MAG: hypothetical protein ILP02_01380 [Clostridia bacterium]|nr:hypothetical protein [Clostridia bacterium]